LKLSRDEAVCLAFTYLPLRCESGERSLGVRQPDRAPPPCRRLVGRRDEQLRRRKRCVVVEIKDET